MQLLTWPAHATCPRLLLLLLLLGTFAGIHLFVERSHVHLDSISCLTNLRSLELIAPNGAGVMLDGATYAAIAQHTQLTKLHLGMIGVNSPGCQFLSGSQQLQELCVRCPLLPCLSLPA